MASEKQILLRHVFKNVKSMGKYDDEYGEVTKHFNLSWSLMLMKNHEDYYDFGFCCDYKEIKKWSVDTEFEFRLIGNEVLTTKGMYYHDESDEGWNKFVTLNSIQIDKYLIGGNLTVECHVKILKTEGIKGMKSKFNEESMRKYSDVVLVVDGEKFYVSKAYLASRSTYFESLLMGQFKESNQSEVVLQGIEVDDFQNFLEILYAETAINNGNLESVLRVADMYETKCVMKQAEIFLSKDSIKSKKEKFDLAVKYNLDKLKESILSKCVDAAEIRSLLPNDLTQFDDRTMTELFKKYLSATSDTFRIFVTPLSGKRIELNVRSTDTMESVKTMVEEKEGTPAGVQRLTLAGKQLYDYKTLSECGVAKDANLALVIALRQN